MLLTITAQGCARDAGPETSESKRPPDYVGRERCVKCHEAAADSWRGSHHDLAMDIATDETVLGDFDDSTFEHFGVVSTFFKRDGRFFVRTDGPDGELHDYEIAYVFGAVPLQQYLVEFPGGRFQALSLCWDTRPAEQGGQRWFHLYPEEPVTHDDVLHWTRPSQNWNYMCAECHSTNLLKGYDPAADRYATTWSEIDVSCEACHGPGSDHVKWANLRATGKPRDPDDPAGLVVDLGGRADALWVMDPETGQAQRDPPRDDRTEIETCARCHSRRGQFHEPYHYGRPLMDTHLPALLEEWLYHADGQIDDEVYVYGSFIQSLMYRRGVTCTDCHDAHSLEIRGSLDGVCAQCHLPSRFATVEHHHHEPGTKGASCVDCHMPSRNYMVVDPRRDHSLRIPRPDLTIEIGIPNACNGCHANRTPEWAAQRAVEWYGPRDEPHYGQTLSAARNDLPGNDVLLLRLAKDPEQPVIARATAVSSLRDLTVPGTLDVVRRALGHRDPLMRHAAVSALEGADPRLLLELVFPLIHDPVRGVRVEAAGAVSSIPAGLLSPEQAAARDRAFDEYRDAQSFNADRPEGQLGLGVLAASLGRVEEAERAYREALARAPEFVPAYVNLADLYRTLARDDEGERLLREGLTVVPDSPELWHSLGLLLARAQRTPEALDALARAAASETATARYLYVYGVALDSTGDTRRALEVLEDAHRSHPGDREILLALATIHRDRGSYESAVEYAARLAELSPWDPNVRDFADQLRRRAP
jgi:Flp pilus assembly protein TadD